MNNELPLEDDTFDDEIANAPNPFWTFINGQSVRVQTKFNRPIITQKRRPKTRTKRFYTEDELKKYNHRELRKIIKDNKLTYGKKETKKVFIDILLKQPIIIKEDFIEIEKSERIENIQEEHLLRKKKYEITKIKLEKMIEDKKIQKEEKIKVFFNTDNYEYKISNRGYYIKINKNNNTQQIKKIKNKFNISEGRQNINLLQGKGGVLVANNFIRKVKKNEEVYHIDKDKNNNDVNNLLIVERGFHIVIQQNIKKIVKGKKGHIQHLKNNKYKFKYLVNRNEFSKTFETKEEAERAQAEYEEKIDDIENPFNSLSVLNLSFHSGKELKKVEIK